MLGGMGNSILVFDMTVTSWLTGGTLPGYGGNKPTTITVHIPHLVMRMSTHIHHQTLLSLHVADVWWEPGWAWQLLATLALGDPLLGWRPPI